MPNSYTNTDLRVLKYGVGNEYEKLKSSFCGECNFFLCFITDYGNVVYANIIPFRLYLYKQICINLFLYRFNRLLCRQKSSKKDENAFKCL